MMKDKIIKGLKWVFKGLKWFFFSFIWFVPIFLAIDILTKLAVVNACENVEGSIVADLIPGFLRIQYVKNDSAAFGIGIGNATVRRIGYIIIASLGSMAIGVYFGLKFKKHSLLTKACLMLILSGALGNLVDRLFYSFSDYCVVDWIDFYGIWPFHFNIADSCIVVGALTLVVYLIVLEVKDAIENKKPKEKVTGKVLSKTEQAMQEEINEAKAELESKNASEKQVEN